MTDVPALDIAWLAEWVQPQHLDASTIASYRREFEQHPAALIVLRSFLVPERARALSRFLEREATYEREYGMHGNRHPVPQDQWLSAPVSERFYQMGVLSGVRPDFRLSENLWTHLKFERAIEDARLLALVERITGFELARPRITVHGMGTGDYLLSHTDEIDDRKIGFVFYLSPEWRPEYGGVLKLYGTAGDQNDFVPQFNALALFDVTRQVEHEVTAVTPAAGDARRLTISGWIGDRRITP